MNFAVHHPVSANMRSNLIYRGWPEDNFAIKEKRNGSTDL
jgi:hypothetical protein